MEKEEDTGITISSEPPEEESTGELNIGENILEGSCKSVLFETVETIPVPLYPSVDQQPLEYFPFALTTSNNNILYVITETLPVPSMRQYQDEDHEMRDEKEKEEEEVEGNYDDNLAVTSEKLVTPRLTSLYSPWIADIADTSSSLPNMGTLKTSCEQSVYPEIEDPFILSVGNLKKTEKIQTSQEKVMKMSFKSKNIISSKALLLMKHLTTIMTMLFRTLSLKGNERINVSHGAVSSLKDHRQLRPRTQ